MSGSVRVCRLFGIDIRIHVTFLILLALVAPGGPRRIALVAAVFGFVTMHEIAHSLVARRFGAMVREITLLPIGGVASMGKMPDRPFAELAVSLAGPFSNLAVVAVFFYPAKMLLGPEVLFHPLSTATWPLTVAYMYWINLILAGFNLIPAFPMDGGRALRSLLAAWLGMARATRIAVSVGHLFALIFAFIGLTRYNLILLAIAVFIYIAASNEQLQVTVAETLKKFRVRDILPDGFSSVTPEMALSAVLQLIFHSRQEDFPVVSDGKLVGFVTRQDLMAGLHRAGASAAVREVMRTSFPRLKESDPLIKVQAIMEAHAMRALPVVSDGRVLGVVTLEDIGRAYALAAERR